MEGKPRDSWRKRQIKFLYFSLILVGLANTLARLEVATTVMPHTVADTKAGAGALVVGANTAPKRRMSMWLYCQRKRDHAAGNAALITLKLSLNAVKTVDVCIYGPV